VVDISAFQMLLLTVTGWLDGREREVLAYLVEENRLLRRQVVGGASSSEASPADELSCRSPQARANRKRKKKGSNDTGPHPHNPDAKITKMNDGQAHLAHKAEHAVDLETGAIVGVTVQDADMGDVETSPSSMVFRSNERLEH
jgi:hypothetical protein